MPFCPHCSSEYRPGVTRCAPCEVDLVEQLPEAAESKADRLREAVEKGEGVPIVRANYAEACQMVEALHQGGVDAVVTGDPKTCGKGGQCSHFFVAVLKEDVEAGLKALRAEWQQLVEADPEHAGGDPDAAVDLDAEGPHACPACGEKFEGAPEECPACGLYLGVG